MPFAHMFNTAKKINDLPIRVSDAYGLSSCSYQTNSYRPTQEELENLFNWYKGKLETISVEDLDHLHKTDQLLPVLRSSGFFWVLLEMD